VKKASKDAILTLVFFLLGIFFFYTASTFASKNLGTVFVGWFCGILMFFCFIWMTTEIELQDSDKASHKALRYIVYVLVAFAGFISGMFLFALVSNLVSSIWLVLCPLFCLIMTVWCYSCFDKFPNNNRRRFLVRIGAVYFGTLFLGFIAFFILLLLAVIGMMGTGG
jgi:hypothetical protein